MVSFRLHDRSKISVRPDLEFVFNRGIEFSAQYRKFICCKLRETSTPAGCGTFIEAVINRIQINIQLQLPSKLLTFEDSSSDNTIGFKLNGYKYPKILVHMKNKNE